jgi:hypothetical protein
MPRIAQPREVAELKGAHKVHPERYRAKVVKNEMPLGQAPDSMAEDVQACWFEIESLALPGTVTASDRVSVEVFATLLAEFRRDPMGFPAAKHAHLKAHIANFGMSPSARQQFTTDEKSDENPFAALDS